MEITTTGNGIVDGMMFEAPVTKKRYMHINNITGVLGTKVIINFHDIEEITRMRKAMERMEADWFDNIGFKIEGEIK